MTESSTSLRPLRFGGVILCGGLSSRMGFPKAWLPIGSEVILQRTVRVLSEVVSPVVVVSAADQSLPELPSEVIVVQDEQPKQGPLEGIRVGLQSLADRADAAFVTSCDAPALVAAFVRSMLVALQDADIAVPVDGKFHHPLAAVYRTRLTPTIAELLCQELRRPLFLFERVATHRIPLDELRSADPNLDSLLNVNSPEDYANLLQCLHLEMPTTLQQHFAERNH